MLVVLTTTPGFSEGSALAERLVESKLAACVQIISQITSVYVWEGKLQKENEQLLLIKTTEDKYAEVENFIAENHSYEVPEIFAIDAAKVSKSYLNWLEEAISNTP